MKGLYCRLFSAHMQFGTKDAAVKMRTESYTKMQQVSFRFPHLQYMFFVDA